MAVESLYCAHPSAAVTCTLLELESCFAAIDEKVVRASDYVGVLQVSLCLCAFICVCARAFAAIIASRCACFVHSLPLLQEIMMQSLVFELSSHGEVRVCPPALFSQYRPIFCRFHHQLFTPYRPRARLRCSYGITFSQAGTKKQSSVAVDARGLSHAAVGSDFFRPLSPENFASVALGTNVSFSPSSPPAFFDVTHHFSCAIALSCFVCAGTALAVVHPSCFSPARLHRRSVSCATCS